MKKLKAMVLSFTMYYSFSLHAQTIDERLFTFEARIQQSSTGTLTIEASSPRPLYQAVESVRGKLSVPVDYEDPRYPDRDMHGEQGANRRLNGGSFTATLTLGQAGSKSDAEQSVRILVNQYDSVSDIPFRVNHYNDFSRVDIVPKLAGQTPLLDTPILVDGEKRTVSASIELILKEVAKKTGACIGRGGLIDNQESAHSVILRIGRETPARDLLAEALSAGEPEKAWLLAYEPSDGCFYFALFGSKTRKGSGP